MKFACPPPGISLLDFIIQDFHDDAGHPDAERTLTDPMFGNKSLRISLIRARRHCASAVAAAVNFIVDLSLTAMRPVLTAARTPPC